MAGEWFYSRDGQQQGPVPQAQLKQMLADGGIQGDALVWCEGMESWQAAHSLREFAPVPVATAVAEAPSSPVGPAATVNQLQYQQPTGGNLMFTPRSMDMLRQTAPWVRLFAILLFIGMGFMALGGVVVFFAGLAASRQGGGAMALFGFVYLVMAGLYFFPALYLNQYASRIGALRQYAREDLLESALEAQKSFWKFVGIATLVVIGLYILIFIMVILGAAIFSGF